jgi:hypothetical protein
MNFQEVFYYEKANRDGYFVGVYTELGGGMRE